MAEVYLQTHTQNLANLGHIFRQGFIVLINRVVQSRGHTGQLFSVTNCHNYQYKFI